MQKIVFTESSRIDIDNSNLGKERLFLLSYLFLNGYRFNRNSRLWASPSLVLRDPFVDISSAKRDCPLITAVSDPRPTMDYNTKIRIIPILKDTWKGIYMETYFVKKENAWFN